MVNDKLELPEAPWGESQKEQGAAGGRGVQEAGEDAFLEMSAGGNATQEALWVQWATAFPKPFIPRVSCGARDCGAATQDLGDKEVEAWTERGTSRIMRQAEGGGPRPL